MSSLTYEFYQKGSTVFKYKDFGDKFYIIIGGKAGVWIPKGEVLNQKDAKIDIMESLSENLGTNFLKAKIKISTINKIDKKVSNYV